MKLGNLSINLKDFFRTSAESTSGEESAHAEAVRKTGASLTGVHLLEKAREPLPLQSPSGTSSEEVQSFLAQAIKFQTPDFERSNKIDKAAEAVEDFIRDLYRHSPTFQTAIREATDNGTAQPSTISVLQGKSETGYEGHFDIPKMSVRTDPHHPYAENDLNYVKGVAAFELFNAASRKRFLSFDEDMDLGKYEQRAQGSGFTPAQLYAKDYEYEEWLNAHKHVQALREASEDGMHVPVATNRYKNYIGTAELPGRGFDFEEDFLWHLENGHAQGYIDYYEARRPSPAGKPGLRGEKLAGEATQEGSR